MRGLEGSGGGLLTLAPDLLEFFGEIEAGLERCLDVGRSLLHAGCAALEAGFADVGQQESVFLTVGEEVGERVGLEARQAGGFADTAHAADLLGVFLEYPIDAGLQVAERRGEDAEQAAADALEGGEGQLGNAAPKTFLREAGEAGLDGGAEQLAEAAVLHELHERRDGLADALAEPGEVGLIETFERAKQRGAEGLGGADKEAAQLHGGVAQDVAGAVELAGIAGQHIGLAAEHDRGIAEGAAIGKEGEQARARLAEYLHRGVGAGGRTLKPHEAVADGLQLLQRALFLERLEVEAELLEDGLGGLARGIDAGQGALHLADGRSHLVGAHAGIGEGLAQEREIPHGEAGAGGEVGQLAAEIKGVLEAEDGAGRGERDAGEGRELAQGAAELVLDASQRPGEAGAVEGHLGGEIHAWAAWRASRISRSR